MATLLKSANFSGTNGTHFKLNLYYDYTQNINNNQTTVTYSLYFQALDGYSGSGATVTGYINGTSVGTTTSIGKNENKLMGTKAVTITHNDDGTFPSTAYSALIDTPWTLGDASVSGNLTGLPTIPRKSYATLSSSSFNIGTSVTLTTNRASNTFTHTVVLAFGSYSKTYNNVGASQVINTSEFASNLYAQIPNTKSGTGTITTTTYNGSSNLGSTSVTFTANAVEANVNPTVNALTYSVDSTTSGLAGNSTTFIANVTTATIRVPIASRSSATLATAFIWYYNGTTKVELARQNASGSSGTYTFTVAPANIKNGIYGGAIDSRGYVTYNTTNKAPATYKDYVVLTADQSAQIARTNQTEPKVKITQFKGNYWSGNFGSQANTLTVRWRYKEGTSSTWSSYYTIPAANVSISGSTYTISNYTLTDGTTQELFNYQKAWNIQFAVTDKIGTKNSSYTITAGVPNFAIFPEHILLNKHYVSQELADIVLGQPCYDVSSYGDWNNIPNQHGLFKGSNMNNSPSGSTINPKWWYVIQLVNDNTYVRQIALSFRNDNQLIYSRAKQAGSWGNWEAIVESGSNANGNYIKYADGTLICTKEISGTLGGNAWGNVYYSDHSIGSYAQTFTSLYYVNASVVQSQYWCNVSGSNLDSVRVFRPNNGTLVGQIKIFAIGRWK